MAEGGLEGVPAPFLILGTIICIVGGGIAAGLTIGLMSLDTVALEILIESGDPHEASAAKKIAPVRKKGNLLLVTLLLTNTAFNEILPLFIDSIPGASGWIALVLPTVTVMLFGEIIPQSFCSRYGLAVGARLIWLVKGLQILFFPVAWPIAWVLNKVLGEELGNVYNHKELKGLIDVHSNKRYGELNDVETSILKGALDLSHKTVGDIMIPLVDVFMLEIGVKLDLETLTKIWHSGHSRIPVYELERHNIVGMLFTKDLILVRAEDELPVRTVFSFYGQLLFRVFPEIKLDRVLYEFKSGQGHMAIVQAVNSESEDVDPWYESIGIITMEDTVKELVQTNGPIDLNEALDVHCEVQRPRINLNAFGPRSTLSPPSHSLGKRIRLIPEQTAAVIMYLSRVVECFKHAKVSERALASLIKQSDFVEISKLDGQTKITTTKTPTTTSTSTETATLCKRGEAISTFTLVVSGKIEVFSGDENIRTEMGPWSYIGLPALTSDIGSYKVDYTAKVLSPTVQLFIISYKGYQQAIQDTISPPTLYSNPKPNNPAAPKLTIQDLPLEPAQSPDLDEIDSVDEILLRSERNSKELDLDNEDHGDTATLIH